MLILYPLENYNSFIDIPTLKSIYSNLTSVPDSTLEQLLKLACISIKSVAIITENYKCDYGLAQANLVNSDILNGGIYLNGLMGEDIKRAKIASLEVEFNTEVSNTSLVKLDAITKNLLYDCLKSNSISRGFYY